MVVIKKFLSLVCLYLDIGKIYTSLSLSNSLTRLRRLLLGRPEIRI